jgi:hypothetical protein
MPVDPEYYQRLEDAIDGILTELAGVLSSTELADVGEFNCHGEYGLALEELCAIISDGGYTVEQSVYEKIVTVGMTIGINSSWWSPIKTK